MRGRPTLHAWCSRCISQHLNTSSPGLRISKMLGYISHLSVYTYIHLSASATACCSIAASIIHVHSLASVVARPQTKIISARLLSVSCLVITTCLGGAVVERIGLVIESRWFDSRPGRYQVNYSQISLQVPSLRVGKSSTELYGVCSLVSGSR